jgi:hypothetical protein
MKKLLTLIIIIMLFGCVFSIAIHNAESCTKSTSSSIAVLEMLSPQVAYADSFRGPIPPPPPPIDPE